MTVQHFYQEGRRARERGRQLFQCPYVPGSAAHVGWRAGWQARDFEIAATAAAIDRSIRAVQ